MLSLLVGLICLVLLPAACYHLGYWTGRLAEMDGLPHKGALTPIKHLFHKF